MIQCLMLNGVILTYAGKEVGVAVKAAPIWIVRYGEQMATAGSAVRYYQDKSQRFPPDRQMQTHLRAHDLFQKPLINLTGQAPSP